MKCNGFAPVFDGESRLLILGSFPSVKSREEGFYYGNPRNRFWSTLCAYFGEEVPESVEEKKRFLLKNHIVLWDMVSTCEIEGSSDASIRGAQYIDLSSLMQSAKIEKIFCNGALSYSALEAQHPALLPIALRLPSTSPANPRFSKEAWFEALSLVFPR